MRRSLPSFEMLNPRIFRSSGRATALFASLTLSRSLLVKNRLTEAMTRSPAIPDAEAESARAPKPTRKSVQAPSISTKANRKAASDRAAAKHEPAAQARQRPNLKPKAAEKT
jgi:phage protein D